MQIEKILTEHGLLTAQQADLARQQTAAAGGANGGAKSRQRFDQAAVEMGFVKEEDVLKALADELGMDFVELKNQVIDLELLNQFPTTAVFRHTLLPLERQNGHVLVATSDPFDLEAIDELSSLSGQRLKPVLARKEDVLEHLKANLGLGGATINEMVKQRSDVELLEDIEEAAGELADEAQSASVIRLVNELLIEALEQQASDVHIEPSERSLRMRYRVDGMLRVQPVPAEINHFYSAIVTRLKIMSHLNIAEKRLPQDGRIKLRVQGREIDVRVSIIPMLYGEGVVLRLLDKERMKFDLTSIGMPLDVLATFKELIAYPHGIVLVTGPTGSGKTSTLYSALNYIKDPTTKIITVEDPVEYHTDGISQIQVHSRIGLTFAAGLRSILRHDPDVVLIGEIRDGETAESAIQASLTGHLVFSTLHTNDAPGAFTRLIDMGVEPYLVASTVEGVLAQRLIRRLCKHCKVEFTPEADDVPPDFPEPFPATLWRAPGCRECRDSGYSGRTGIYELLRNDPVVRQLTVENASAGQIREYGLKAGMKSLRQSGFEKVRTGETSIEEILRVTKGDLS